MNRLDDLNSWRSDWRGLKVAVLGLGVSGFSVADTLAELGADLLVLAEKAEPELTDILDVLEVRHLSGTVSTPLEPTALNDALVEFMPEIIITSPGLTPNNPMILWAKTKDIPVWIDIELAWRLRDKSGKVADWLVVTGTNGKTTTSQLLEAMLLQSGQRAIACGNIGVPILDAIRDPLGYDCLVVELSSFQLHYLGQISPVASAVLNLADDHLDWHGNFDAYRDAKAKVYENTSLACVYNVNDSATEALVENAEVIEGARAIGFTTGIPSRSQVGFVEDILCDRAFVENRAESALEIATLDDLSQIGVLTPHLMANVAAATAMARAVGVTPEAIRSAIRGFRLDAHRIELIAESDGVRWVDDSKATNPHAAAASLSSFDKVIWIVGGLLKGVDLSDLVDRFKDRLSAAVVIGAQRNSVIEALQQNAPGLLVVEIAESDPNAVMQAAVVAAKKLAKPGDTVLLAPAAASMDQFRDYAHRGEAFAEAVNIELGEI